MAGRWANRLAVSVSVGVDVPASMSPEGRTREMSNVIQTKVGRSAKHVAKMPHAIERDTPWRTSLTRTSTWNLHRI
ncbi:hypothetical protein B0T21DRAFT_361235 [Apiosordaria backusii]|uniref:Uncharacterized protein n=1 Tax=Apiosordaria backusii TaxID=314023 RepID=A0AA40EN58_9PEZI|nr:hypothetical protein B0T21DRAFT_361235 [Apiosordaria backusii]